MKGHRCDPADPCRACERAAEERKAGSDEIEQPDAFGRDADWTYPREYGAALTRGGW